MYKTLSPVEFGTPAERRGAERSTSGVKCVAWIVMALCLRDCSSHIKGDGREQIMLVRARYIVLVWAHV